MICVFGGQTVADIHEGLYRSGKATVREVTVAYCKKLLAFCGPDNTNCIAEITIDEGLRVAEAMDARISSGELDIHDNPFLEDRYPLFGIPVRTAQKHYFDFQILQFQSKVCFYF